MNDPRFDLPSSKQATHKLAPYSVWAKQTDYSKFIRIFKPLHPYSKNTHRENKSSTKQTSSKPPSETDIERSLRRTRKAIKDYALCNEFDIFATFTFKGDRQNVAGCKSQFSNWLKNIQKRSGKIEYIAVPEFHKDGVSIHFHVLIKGYRGKIRRTINPHTGKPLVKKGRKIYELPSYRSGHNTIEMIDEKKETSTKVAFYIQKYITKDMPRLFGKNRYWASRGLNKPQLTDNPEEWYLHVKPDREYPNDYGQILEFDVGKNPLVDIFWKVKQK